MADDIDVDAITKLLNDPTVPVELRNEIVNDWVLADPTAKDTWGPLVESNKLTLTDDSKRALFVANGPFGGPDGLQGVILKQQQAIAREALTKDVATGTTVAGASQRSKDLASSPSGASTSDELLDQASEGLRYFEVFLPLYSRVKNPGAMSRDAACARYDESREMSFAAMRSDATLVTTAAGDLEPEQRSIGDQAQHLAPVWTGKAGKAATTYLGTFGTEAAQVRTWLTSAASALSHGADQLEASVRAKAVAVSGLYTGQVGGKTPDQVDTIITVKQGNPFSSDNDDTIKSMSQWFPGIKLDERCMNDDLTEETRYSAIQSCQQFVESSFEPAVENTWKDFIQTCDTCDTSVKQIYTVITDTLGAVNPAVFAPLDTGVPATPPEGKHGGTDGRSTSTDPEPRTTGRDGGTPLVSGSVPTAGDGGVAPTGGAGPAPTPGGFSPADVPTAAPVTSQGVGGATETPVPGLTPTAVPGLTPTAVPGLTPTAVPGLTPTAVPVGLPTGAGWVSDPTSLPKGWTIDPTTGQLLPPQSPGGKGDPEVHSAAAGELLDGDGKGDLGGASPGVGGHGPATVGPATVGPATVGPATVGPATVGPTTVDPATGQPTGVAGVAAGVTGGPRPADGVTGSTLTVTDQGVSMQISAEDAGGGGAHIDVTDSTGQVTGYRVEIGADGAPHLVPDTAVAPVNGAGTPAAASGTASAPGAAPPASATTVGAGAASSFDGGAATVDTASAPAAADTGSTSSAAPTPALVHSAAVGGSWVDPAGAAAGGGSGAQLASAHSGAGAGSPGTSGAQLAGTGHDGSAGTSGPDGSGTTGMGGTGAAGGAGGDNQEHRVSQQWRVLDDTFDDTFGDTADDDSGTWATLSDVLGPRDRQAAGDQENR